MVCSLQDYKRFLCEFISGVGGLVVFDCVAWLFRARPPLFRHELRCNALQAGRCSSLDFDMQSLQRQILKIQLSGRAGSGEKGNERDSERNLRKPKEASEPPSSMPDDAKGCHPSLPCCEADGEEKEVRPGRGWRMVSGSRDLVSRRVPTESGLGWRVKIRLLLSVQRSSCGISVSL